MGCLNITGHIVSPGVSVSFSCVGQTLSISGYILDDITIAPRVFIEGETLHVQNAKISVDSITIHASTANVESGILTFM